MEKRLLNAEARIKILEEEVKSQDQKCSNMLFLISKLNSTVLRQSSKIEMLRSLLNNQSSKVEKFSLLANDILGWKFNKFLIFVHFFKNIPF